MQIHILSDLHTEFQSFWPTTGRGDVVVLAGDIGIKLAGLQLANKLAAHRPVIYVIGNHEYYGSAIPHLISKLRAKAEGTGVYVLEKDACIIQGVRFLGCTLWTDFSLFGLQYHQQVMRHAEEGMEDYHRIRVSPSFRRLRPFDTVAWFHESVVWLRQQFSEPFDGPTVVVSHHSPSKRSIAPAYVSDPLAPAFASDLDAQIKAFSPVLWIHGHTHHCVDYDLNGTRIVSNQRGYPDELVPEFREDLVIDVERH